VIPTLRGIKVQIAINGTVIAEPIVGSVGKVEEQVVAQLGQGLGLGAFTEGAGITHETCSGVGRFCNCDTAIPGVVPCSLEAAPLTVQLVLCSVQRGIGENVIGPIDEAALATAAGMLLVRVLGKAILMSLGGIGITAGATPLMGIVIPCSRVGKAVGDQLTVATGAGSSVVGTVYRGKGNAVGDQLAVATGAGGSVVGVINRGIGIAVSHCIELCGDHSVGSNVGGRLIPALEGIVVICICTLFWTGSCVGHRLSLVDSCGLKDASVAIFKGNGILGIRHTPTGSDVDIVQVHGYGLPRCRGDPIEAGRQGGDAA
jgi:hypothetical protein